MKKIITLLTLISISLFGFAQLSNPSFETWENPLLHNTINATGTFSGITFYVCGDFDYNELENWSSTNQMTKGVNLGNIELVTESTTAYAGAKSVKIESKDVSLTGFLSSGCVGLSQSIDNVAPGLMVSGSFKLEVQGLIDEILTGSGLNALNPFTYPGVGEPIDFIPRSISGYYQYTGGVDATTGLLDSCIIVSGLKKNGVLIGSVVTRLGNASSWTPFHVDYDHLTCEIPDTIVTVISSSGIDLEIVNGEFIINSDNTGADGSVLLIDDIKIDTITLAEFPPLLSNDFDTIFTNEVSTVDIQNNDVYCATVFPAVLDYSGSEGAAVLTGSSVEFTPSLGFTGNVTIPYYSCNNIPLCDTAYFYVQVEPLPLCYANNDNYSLTTNGTTNNDVRLNDVDCGTSISIVANTVNGVANLESNGTITYSPNGSFTGVDSLKYSICSDVAPTQCDTAVVRYTITTGINEISENLIQFFPNPAKNSINISIDLPSEIHVTIYNTLGEKMIVNSFFNANAIDLISLNNGLYFVEIETAGKKTIKKLQVIK